MSVQDVTSHGALGNGIADDGPAISAALNAIPAASFVAISSDLPVGGGVVSFPTPANVYAINAPIIVPSDKNVLFVGTASHAVTLDLVPTELEYSFIVQGGSCAVTFERLTFRHGGVLLQGPRTGPIVFRDCVFTCSRAWAVKATYAGTGATRNVSFYRCLFAETGPQSSLGVDDLGAIWMGKSAEAWRIEGSTFKNVTGTGVRIDGFGCRIVGCLFESSRAEIEWADNVQKIAAAPYRRPFVHVSESSRGAVRISRCRFGLEQWPTRDLIVIGPLDELEGTTTPAPRVYDVQVVQCDFAGVANGELGINADSKSPSWEAFNKANSKDDATARSVIRLTSPVTGLQLRDNSCWRYKFIIYEEAVTFAPSVSLLSATAATAMNDQNVVDGLFIAKLQGVGRLFSEGGRGFEIDDDRLRESEMRSSPDHRPGGNLLTSNGSSVGFVVANETDDYFELPPVLLSPNEELAYFSIVLSDYAMQQINGGPVVASAWLRAAAGMASARLEVRVAPKDGSETIGSGGRSAVRAFALDELWRRCHVVAEAVPSSSIVTLVVRLGFSHDTPRNQKVVVVGSLQMETGAVPSPGSRLGLDETVHVPRSNQSIAMGSWELGYTNTAPASGASLFVSHFQRGDRVFTSNPVNGTPLCWVFDMDWRPCLIVGQ